MKTRQGFVSNSSSSSFICNVCGNMESGMDMCASDLGFMQCVNGHTFCDTHAEKMPKQTPADIRNDITEQITTNKWWDDKTKKEALQELTDTPDNGLDDLLRNSYSDDGVAASCCPICTFTSLDHDDGYNYLKLKYKLTDKDILEEIKKQFNSYLGFEEAIKPK